MFFSSVMACLLAYEGWQQCLQMTYLFRRYCGVAMEYDLSVWYNVTFQRTQYIPIHDVSLLDIMLEVFVSLGKLAR